MSYRNGSLLLLLALLSACASTGPVANQPGGAWTSELGGVDLGACHSSGRPADLAEADFTPPATLSGSAPFLAPGDRLRLRLAGDEDRISGDYVVDDFGRLRLPDLEPVDVRGLDLEALRARLGRDMVEQGLARPLSHPLELRLLETSGAAVAVSGAVFEPGVQHVGDRPAESRVQVRDPKLSGDANPIRSLATALRAAGGVRPDARVSEVYLARGGRWTRLDLSGEAVGGAVQDIAVAPGDRIIVASDHCFHRELVRPTSVTAPGIRVYASNLARPAAANATAAVGRDVTNLPYGVRMLDGLVAANCVGGSAMNAGRVALLVTRNPYTGQSVAILRRVQDLVRNPNRDDENPYLMPNDDLACYDSRMMNVADAINLFTSTVNAASNVMIAKNLAR